MCVWAGAGKMPLNLWRSLPKSRFLRHNGSHNSGKATPKPKKPLWHGALSNVLGEGRMFVESQLRFKSAMRSIEASSPHHA